MLTNTITTNITGLTPSLNQTLISNINGLTPAELATLTGLLANLTTPADIANITPSILEQETQLLSKLNNVAKAQKVSNNDNKLISQYQTSSSIQDNIVSTKIAETPVVSSKFTSVNDFPIAENNFSDDYPNTEGSIDEAHNWFKINKTSGYTEFVHNSGCSLKLDKSGNCSVHITGNLKWVVDKQWLVNIVKEMDLHVMSDLSIQSKSLDTTTTGDNKTTSPNLNINVSGTTTVNSITNITEVTTVSGLVVV